jgi:cell division protein FtsQ
MVRPRYGREAREYEEGPHRERRLRGFLVLGAVLAVVIGALSTGAYFGYTSNLVRVKVTEVEGAVLSSPEEIAARAELFGESLLTADLAAAEGRIREMPLIQDATLERRWPRTVRIVVTERQAWGVWEQSGVAYTIDAEGVVLGTTVAPPSGSPVIRSSEQGSRLPGDRVDRHAVDATARIWTQLPAQLGVEVTEVAFLAGKGVQVTTGDGQVALFGDSSGIDYKIAAWAAMARKAAEEGIVYRAIDLRFGNRPVLVQ